MATEITQRQGAQQRLADRVRQHVGVRVPAERAVEVYRNSAQDERPAVNERMQVESEADAGHRAPVRRARRRSSGVVLFAFSASPRTTGTGCPSRSTSIASSVPTTPSRRAFSWASRST